MMPTVAPLLTASSIKTFASIPWNLKLSSTLQRRIIQELYPQIAKFRTAYGATAEPPSACTLHLELKQLAHQTRHIAEKFDKILLNGALLQKKDAVSQEIKPFWMDDFGDLFHPDP